MAQEVNQELLDNLSHYYRKKYAPEHAFADAVGMLQMFPGVVAIWPMSVVFGSGNVIDLSGSGTHLTNNNTVTFNAASDGLVAYANFVAASSQYLSHTDGVPFDISGTEAFIGNVKGLTVGGWYNFDVITGTPGLMTKWNSTGNNRSYALTLSGASLPVFQVSNTGAAVTNVATSTTAVAASRWYFIAGTYVPSTSISVWVNGLETVNTTAITASVFNGASIFSIGSFGNPTAHFDGKASLCFLCAAAVPDHFIETFYDFTRPLFGV